MRFVYAGAVGALAAAAVLGAGDAKAADCMGLSGKTLGGAVIVETNDVKPPFMASSMGSSATVTKPFCRVRGLLRPTSDSDIYFEVWLPPAESWNGKYQGNAPGGFAGNMLFGTSAMALQAGYAASTTDNGHVGSNAVEWAVGHPEKVHDWGWRAVHETAVASKAVIAEYYGRGPKYSYFVGCSKGGGSAITEAQRFPTDYNGIIANAMGWDHTAQLTKYLWALQTVSAPGGWLSPAKLATLHKAVMAHCGDPGQPFLDDPGACKYDPGPLRCRRGDADTCLTAAEVNAVRRIYDGPRNSQGRSLSAGYPRGAELAWTRIMMGEKDKPGIGTQVHGSFTNFVRAMLFEHDNYDLQKLNPEEIHKQAQAKLGVAWDATNPDLSAFKAAGGKMITYHGWNDNNVPPEGGIRYYDMVEAKMGDPKSFYRLFMAPGMEHCGGGLGPNAAGGSYGLPSPVRDADHDVVAALEKWVEEGVAPEKLIATKYVDNSPAKGIEAQRPWCVHPQVARYSGKGDRTQAANWACVRPAASRRAPRR